MILIDANENPYRYPASYNSSSQQDLTHRPSQHPPQTVQPPPYEFGHGYTSRRYPEATTPQTETPIQPQHSQPYGSLPLSSESSPSRPPFGGTSQFLGTNSVPSFRDASSSGITHDPPPSSFLRQPPKNLPYDSFQPMFLIANGKFLDKGFPLVAPPSAAQPHPFASHDVNEGDWTWFIHALRKASTISDKQNAIATHVPLIQDLPVVSILVAKAIKTHMKKKKKGPASDLVNTWNHHFFHLRRMEVVLMQGQVRLSGRLEHPIPNLPTIDDSSMSSLSPSREEKRPYSNSQALVESQGQGVSTAKEKGKDREEESDKIYRLYVVPL